MIRAGDSCDVVVIGAGPAGSTAAQLLASWGWAVAVVNRRARGTALAESLPATTRKLLALVGALPAVEAAAFQPNTGNVASWADATRTTTSETAGFHVPRDAFDALLLDRACAAGARTIDGVVRRVELGEPAEVSGAGSDREPFRLHARYVLDCSGRSGIVARRGYRRAEARYRTIAIAAEWWSDGWLADEHTRTLVESYDEGWAWSVPLSATRRQCTVMIDGRQRDPGSLERLYARQLHNASMISGRITAARAQRVGAPWACDASIYDCHRAADESVLLVGDASSFIEPLSSAGVKKALLAGWRAAVVANTMLKRPEMAGAARDFYSAREREVFADAAQRAAGFFVEAADAYRSPFWETRADAARAAAAADHGARWSDDALAQDARVRAAFDFLRTTTRLQLRLADTLRFAPVPAIEGHEVVLRDGVVLPGAASAVPFAAGVDLAALARLARGGTDVPGMIAAYQSEVGRVPVSGLLAGLSLLVAGRALVAEGHPS